MKKILFLLACTLLVGCGAPAEIPDPIEIGEHPVHYFIRPYHFEYNGHKYIYFAGNNSSIVHDPECCKEEASIW